MLDTLFGRGAVHTLDGAPHGARKAPFLGGHAAAGLTWRGEDATIALIAVLAPRLAALDYRLPGQDLSISLRRIPARRTGRTR